MNKLIVVTGGTKGIGRAIIEKFLTHDFDIVTCSRTPGDLQALAIQVETQYPRARVHTMLADLAGADGIAHFCEFVLSLGRSVDVLVNNTGYFVPGQIINETSDTLRKMIEANLYSAYDVTRALLPRMLDVKSAYIFNMCSIASFMAYPNGGSYAISKFALLGFSKCLRAELRDQSIRVSAIMPGATRTASWDGTSLPDERFMSPEDVADTIYSAYALSDRTVIEEIVLRPQLGDL